MKWKWRDILLRLFQPPMTPERLRDRIQLMERLCPSNADLQVLGRTIADRQAQRLTVVNLQLWLVRNDVNLYIEQDRILMEIARRVEKTVQQQKQTAVLPPCTS